MNNIILNLNNNKYSIFIDNNINILLIRLKKILSNYLNLNYSLVIISNRILDFLYFYNLNIIFNNIIIYKYILQDGEKYKNFNTINNIINYLLINKFNRHTLLISLGGGVISDITGFVASIYQRGIPYINIPTTLLAQIDASIGGKTGINHKLGKNLIGTINQPISVLINLSFLKSLSIRQLKSGIGEMIKYSCLNKLFFNWLKKNLVNVLNLKKNALKYSIFTCCSIKSDLVIKDEYETNNNRVLLNLGHTFAHAIEAYYQYSNKYLHGEAVGIGIILSSYVSMILGIINKSYIKNIKYLLNLALLPINIPKYMLKEDYLYFMKKDKKNIIKNKISLIIPTNMGECKLYYNISDKIIIKAIKLASIK